MDSFNEARFRARVDAALTAVRTILENEKKPSYAENVPHEYEDKYLLAEQLVNSALGALVNSFDALGFTEKDWATIQGWNATRSVTLRASFAAEEKCKFLRKVEREVKSDTTHVTQSTLFGTSKSYTVTKITEWFWQFTASYELQLINGNDKANPIVIKKREASIELKTTADVTPRPVSVVVPTIDVNISWFLRQIDSEKKNAPKFAIDRANKATRTPRRNAEVSSVFSQFAELFYFATNVHSYFTQKLWPITNDHGIDLSSISSTYNNNGGIFVPVLPLFEGQGKDEKKKKKKKSSKKDKKDDEPAKVPGSGSGVVPVSYVKDFLAEQRRTMSVVFATNEKVFATPTPQLPSVQEANILSVLLHLKMVGQSVTDGLDYIELMLRNQLIAAIGKIVQPSDLAAYMRFHYRKLFADDFQPNQFCYAVRRPDHYPEGLLSIEADVDGSLPDPVATIVRHVPSVRRPMKFNLDASTTVSFYGERFLHGFVAHQFSGVGLPSLNLVARARQFSSFILMVGRIASADLFEPKYAIIIKDKDELKLPLLLETLPTPKEFRDAIESLSPEQQRFAKAYRSMQLESTLFGVAVIQIKPALEKLLNLPNDSLTKEIALLQDLMEIFIEYQVPSDLISYDGDSNASKAGKLSVVKGYVEAMKEMIKKNKQTSLEEAEEKQDYRISNNDELAAQIDYLEIDQDEVEERPMKKHAKKKMVFEDKKKEYKEKEYKEKEKDSSVKSKKAAPSGGRGGGGAGRGGRLASASAAPSSNAKPAAVTAPTTGSSTATPTPTPGSNPVTSPRENVKIDEDAMDIDVADDEEEVDYTKIPAELEEKYTELDVDGALRPTIINPGNDWQKSFRTSLLSDPETKTLFPDDQGKERNRAFDLIDALTKSGALSVDEASLHVVIAATHSFDKSLIDVLVQDSINPIEKVERSALIIASTIHGVDTEDLIRPEQKERIALYSPMLIANDGDATADTVAASSSSPSIAPVKKGTWVF